jgi:hypothetical protein
MTKEEALVVLAKCYRHVCDDRAFGDAEIFWTKTRKPEGKENFEEEDIVADGYAGREGSSFVMCETGEGFEMPGHELRSLGLYGSYSRNDSMDG